MSDIQSPTAATSIEFGDAIRATAKEMGRMPSAGQVAILNAMAQTHGRLDPEASTVVFDKDDGTVEGVGEFLAREVGKFSKVVTHDSVSAGKYVGLTAAALSVVQRIRAQDEADALAHANAVAAGPNPFDKVTWNLTKQAIIRKQLPHIATQLKARAR